MDNSLLGKSQPSPEVYSPQILFPIERATTRMGLGYTGFQGVDVWQAFELSWLDNNGKPQVAMGRFFVPCDSPNIIESKSLKLYLNSLNFHRCESQETVQSLIAADLSAVAGKGITVQLMDVDEHSMQVRPVEGVCLDTLQPLETVFDYKPTLLSHQSNAGETAQRLYSNLFRSCCPVTGQPDWATIVVQYEGLEISQQALLGYLLSFRSHQEFHEQCAERIFSDIMERLAPSKLLVEARFLRRGGLDISPLRYCGYQPADIQHYRCFRQ